MSKTISIDVTTEQHNQLKALATQSGKSIEDYVLGKTLLLDAEDETDMQEFLEFLKPRIEEASRGEVVNQSVTEIVEEVYKELGVK